LDEKTLKDYYTEEPGPHIHMIDSMEMLGYPEFLKPNEKESPSDLFITSALDQDDSHSRESPYYQAYPDYKMNSNNTPSQLYIPTERVMV
jgi:hypothetical protein